MNDPVEQAEKNVTQTEEQEDEAVGTEDPPESEEPLADLDTEPSPDSRDEES